MTNLTRYVLAVLLLGLTACQSPQLQHQRMLLANPANQQKMVDDAVRQLALLYPPAQSTLHLSPGANTGFDSCLIDKLRARGYAVLELSAQTTTAPPDSAKAISEREPDDQTAAKTIELSFDVSPIPNADLTQLKLLINQHQSLSRAYQPAQDGSLVKASHWIYKE